ncbi:uroporphyrinogen-III C-methyltransferase [Paludicola sp. MB14-C6]|uniref:uroporphyrinogen-III C-methyltransferase n=1 Tax=Paludihabitans sp. MB14-C6 TaxID=3070656 RepID=UPI0027DCDB56|nr:uroporphyrinogen-III C-methyltransferase [Paludicola sp. MB14-C6]WMJ22038.1 uroporphyrinogen-III C-methyltransferase [Paludicola sp. MB14-C6]
MAEYGKVFLVGAGPGDEDMLTVKAKRLIENAQVVVFDRLVSEPIMNLIPDSAIKINVGKNVGDHPVPQEEINQILVDKAKEGYDVVRLKGGDSFLFGRGGEELELLCENKINFEVIPGITSAIAAAAYAGIPVTHRDYCSSLHIITGHKKKDGALDLDYSALVKLNGTLIFMMSVANIGEIAKGLMENGMSPSMDCAIVENGTRPNQRKFVADIGTIKQVIANNNVKSPALIVVGKVCSLADKFDWFSNQPLSGKRILVTRPKANSNKLAEKLKSLGADVISIAAIKTKPIDFIMPQLENYTMLIFTSAVGVDVFFQKLLSLGKDTRQLSGLKIAVVGKETAKALLNYGIQADFIPNTFSGEILAKEMLQKEVIGQTDKLLLLRAKDASKELTNILSEYNIRFEETAVYETVYEKNDSINPLDFDLVTFTSASCVDGFINSVNNPFDFSTINAVCIGEQTAAEAKKYNMNITISKEATIDSMVECIGGIYHASKSQKTQSK